MKIAVISDTHDHLSRLERAIGIANDKNCEHLLHLGDIVSPFSAQALKKFQGMVNAVFGNNDGEIMGLSRTFTAIGGEIERGPVKLEMDGKRVLMMHEPWLLEELAHSGDFDYILYGHLHRPDRRRLGSTWILNPGDGGGWTAKPTFLLIDTATDVCQQIEL